MDNSILSFLLAVFASSGLWSVITLIVQNKLNSRNKENEEQKKMNRMVMGLGHDRITLVGMSYIERGYVTKNEYEDLITYLYNPYKDLGGNGTAELVIKKVQTLPMKQSHTDESSNKD